MIKIRTIIYILSLCLQVISLGVYNSPLGYFNNKETTFVNLCVGASVILYVVLLVVNLKFDDKIKMHIIVLLLAVILQFSVASVVVVKYYWIIPTLICFAGGLFLLLEKIAGAIPPYVQIE